MTSTSIRVPNETLAALRELSEDEQTSIGQIVANAVKQYRKDKFWKEMHEGFSKLREDPQAWQEYQDELAEWETLNGDGLQDEAPYFIEEQK